MLPKISIQEIPTITHSADQKGVKDNLQAKDKLPFTPKVIVGTKRQSAITLCHRIIKNLKNIFTHLINKISKCFDLNKKPSLKQNDVNEKKVFINLKSEDIEKPLLAIADEKQDDFINIEEDCRILKLEEDEPLKVEEKRGRKKRGFKTRRKNDIIFGN